MIAKRRPLIQKAKGHVRKLERNLKSMGGELSESVSACSSLLGETSSGSSSSSDAEPEAEKKAKVTPKAKAEAKKDSVPDKVEPEVDGNDKAVAKEDKSRRCKRKYPEIARGESAPNHKGKANAKGEFYPGYPKGDASRCESCEQLRRGFEHVSKARRPGCAWRVRG